MVDPFLNYLALGILTSVMVVLVYGISHEIPFPIAKAHTTILTGMYPHRHANSGSQRTSMIATVWKLPAEMTFVFGLCLALSAAAQSADIDGAWTNSADVCSKVFVKKGDRISFADDADMYGSGFIVEGNRIRGKMATCNITRRKETGDSINLIAACSTEIAIETQQIVFKIISPERLSREYPGVPELASTYERCSFGRD
jgi:hypothetical protein